MPEDVWDDGRRSGPTQTDAATKYQNSAFNIPSTIAGTVDQFIDKATGIVQLTKTALEAFRNPRATFNNIYNSVKSLNVDKIKQIISDITGISNYQAGGSRATYQGGRHTIQIAMAVLGSVKVLNQGNKIVREGGAGMTDVQKFIPDGTTGHPSANALKNAADNNHVVINIRGEKLLTRNKIDNEDVFVGIEKREQLLKFMKHGNRTSLMIMAIR